MSRVSSAKLPKTNSFVKLSSRRVSERPNEAIKASKPRPKTALNQKEYERVRKMGKTISNEETQPKSQKDEGEQRRLEQESEERKRSLRELDAILDEKMGKNQDPFKVELEEQHLKLRSRALSAKHEEEEEVKRANKIILAAKVHVLQDAQINEKKELEKMWREKEMRLEQMMLEQDAKKLAEQKRLEQERKEIRDKYANELKDGFKQRELKKLMEAERVENEAKLIALTQQMMKEEEEKKVQADRVRRMQLKKDFQETFNANEESRKRANEQKRAAEMKAQEYMRLKLEQEKELQKERKLQREKKQKQIDQILKRQKELMQTKEESEVANMRRIQEQKEREFRRKTMEAAIKKKEMEETVLRDRAAQIEDAKRIRARKDEQEAMERQMELDRIKEYFEKEKAEKERMGEYRKQYKDEIISQINQKTVNRQTNKVLSNQEYVEQKKREEQRQENIRKIIAAKVEEMRASRIPERIIRDVERQLNFFNN